MKLKKLLAIMLSAAIGLSLVACGAKDAEPTQDAGDDAGQTEDAGDAGDVDASDIHISLICKTLSAEYWKTMEKGAQKAGEDLGIKVTVLGPNAESEIAQQVTQIEEQLAAGVDAICVAPCEENAIIGALTPAVGKIPVIIVDSQAALEGKTAFIGTGNTKAAKLGGDYIAETLGEGSKAILIGGQQGEATSSQRLDGFREGLEEGGVIVLEEQFGNNTADKAMAVMEDLLTKYPGEIDAVLAMNDDMAMGCMQACDNAGVTDITIVGFNADSAAVDLVEEGRLAATIAQQPYLMGYQSIEQAFKAINGETVEEEQDVPAELVTIDNVAEFKAKQADLK